MAKGSTAGLGEIIRQQREQAELSMRQFAERVGISNPYLSQIERGMRAPSQQVLEGIANALQVSADALYEQAGVAPPRVVSGTAPMLEAIANDPHLSARQRSAMREIYEAFLYASTRGVQPGPAAIDRPREDAT